MAVQGTIAAYRSLLLQDPVRFSNTEQLIKTLTYALSIVGIEEISQFVYTATNLVTLLNDTILRKACLPNQAVTGPRGDLTYLRLLNFLTVMESVETLLEVASFTTVSKAKRWALVVGIEVLKTIVRLFLTFRHGSTFLPNPPLTSIDRQLIVCNMCGGALISGLCPNPRCVEHCPPRRQSEYDDVDPNETNFDEVFSSAGVAVPGDTSRGPLTAAVRWQCRDCGSREPERTGGLDGSPDPNTHIGRRTGRVIKGPSKELWPSSWQRMQDILEHSTQKPCSTCRQRCERVKELEKGLEMMQLPSPTMLTPHKLGAELLFIMRPCVHLLLTYKFGTQSWKPWVSALAMELGSYHLAKRVPSFSANEKSEVKRRRFMLLFFLFRSPFFEKMTMKPLLFFFGILRMIFPTLAPVSDATAQYIRLWQQLYFYTWRT